MPSIPSARDIVGIIGWLAVCAGAVLTWDYMGIFIAGLVTLAVALLYMEED